MAESSAGIEGVISVSPSHPGPIREGVDSTAPVGNMEFAVRRESAEVASFKTDDQGRFRIALAPGHYTVIAKNRPGRIGRFGPFEVEVAAGKMTKVEWSCDSGMR